MSSGFMNPGVDSRIVQLRHAAMNAAANGQYDEASRLWDQVLTLSPDYPEALHFKGQRAMQRGDLAGARGLFGRAARAAPKDPIVQLGLAFACQRAGDDRAEMAALTAALTADPYCYPALLAKGANLERNGLKRQAARIYSDALKIVPPDERLAPVMRDQVKRARKAVDENAVAFDAFLERKIGPIRIRHASANQNRADEAKGAMLGRNKIYKSEASLLHFPQLPAVPYFDRSHFPWLRDIEAQTASVQEELHSLLGLKKDDFKPYMNYPADAPLNQWAELNNSPRWSALNLWKDGRRVEKNCAVCPQTAAALGAVPMLVVPGAEPTVMFSALEPHTTIPAHTGITNARAVVHLPLILPGQCRFRVGNETREWKMGEAWVFDDTIEHEAWNDSDQLRVILIFNVWNPYLSEVERELASELICGFYEFHSAG